MANPSVKSPQRLRAGDRVFLVVSLDVKTDKVDARKAVVLDQRPDMLVVGQPDPALPKNMVGKTLEVAVFPPAPPGTTACSLPVGYHAKIVKFFPGYPGVKSGFVPALGLTPPRGSWHQAIIRMHVRAQVQPEHGLGVEIANAEQASIVDISGGGALLTIKGMSLCAGRVLNFNLVFPDGGTMALESEIRWTAPAPDPEAGTLAGVRFRKLTVTESRYMARLAQQILSPCQTILKSPGTQKTMPWPTTFRTHG